MERRDILSIDSLPVDPTGNLFGLVEYKDFSHGLIEINNDKENYSLDEKILSYGKGQSICQAIIIPFGSFKGENNTKYNFSVVSCTNLKYLDLNGEKIKGTEVEEDQSINRVESLELKGKKLEVIYSGYRLKQIIKAKIDLEKRKAKSKVLIRNLSNYVWALEPIKDDLQHQIFVVWGKSSKKQRTFHWPEDGWV